MKKNKSNREKDSESTTNMNNPHTEHVNNQNKMSDNEQDESVLESAAEMEQAAAGAEEPSETHADDGRNELKTLKEELAEAKDKYVRLYAEFDNYRRRTAKERLDLIGTASEDVLVGFLPVLDDCERALQVLKETNAADKAAIEGTELIYNKLVGYLRSKGVSKIDAVGKDFDTDFHEAVAQFPAQDKKQKNKVIDIAQQGYTLNGKVIRFAKVVIGI